MSATAATAVGSFQFTKAVKERAKLRLALIAPAGCGKTYSALGIATALTPGKVALIDTEHGSAAKYADLFEFDSLELKNFDPENYVRAIRAAEEAGYETIVIDSLSHAWAGPGGALALVDQAAAKSKSGSTFHAWKDVTPKHQALIEGMLQSRCHVIATMRSKVEHVYENGKVKKVGLQPVQREGMEYEFDLVGDIDQEHRLIITKSRIAGLDGQVMTKPGAELGRQLVGWLKGAEPRKRDPQPAPTTTPSQAPAPAPTKAAPSPAPGQQQGGSANQISDTALQEVSNQLPYFLAALCGPDATKDAKSAKWREFLSRWGVDSARKLSPAQGEECLALMLKEINKNDETGKFLAGESDGAKPTTPAVA